MSLWKVILLLNLTLGLGVNDIGEEIHSTPALSGGRIYVRTRGTVYCFGAK